MLGRTVDHHGVAAASFSDKTDAFDPFDPGLHNRPNLAQKLAIHGPYGQPLSDDT
jgi:hypothetical protein